MAGTDAVSMEWGRGRESRSAPGRRLFFKIAMRRGGSGTRQRGGDLVPAAGTARQGEAVVDAAPEHRARAQDRIGEPAAVGRVGKALRLQAQATADARVL